MFDDIFFWRKHVRGLNLYIGSCTPSKMIGNINHELFNIDRKLFCFLSSTNKGKITWKNKGKITWATHINNFLSNLNVLIFCCDVHSYNLCCQRCILQIRQTLIKVGNHCRQEVTYHLCHSFHMLPFHTSVKIIDISRDGWCHAFFGRENDASKIKWFHSISNGKAVV